MPSLGADMEAGILVEWLKQPGDAIRRGEIIAVVETDKGAIEIEVFESGVLREWLVKLGQKVPVGTPLALIDGDGAVPATSAPAAPAPLEKPVVAGQLPAPMPLVPVRPAAVEPAGGRLRISPLAARRAAELGVPIAGLAGTGAGGAIRLADVEAVAGQPLPAREPAADDTATRQAGMRRAIAAAMARAKREIPHYYLATTVDLAGALDWLAAANRARGVADRLLLGVLYLKATARALKEVPELNGTWQDGARLSEAVHIGWAVSLRGGGLIAPAIHDVAMKSLDTLMVELRDLVRRARSGGLRSSELTDPTITVTSMGERGVETIYGVIYPPQLAIVGFGRTVERPWVVDASVVPRPVVDISLSADHRASDGHRGGLFLAELGRLLQEPETL